VLKQLLQSDFNILKKEYFGFCLNLNGIFEWSRLQFEHSLAFYSTAAIFSNLAVDCFVVYDSARRHYFDLSNFRLAILLTHFLTNIINSKIK